MSNTEKALSKTTPIIEKLNPDDELWEWFGKVKEQVTLIIQKRQEQLADKASDMQSKIDKINGN